MGQTTLTAKAAVSGAVGADAARRMRRWAWVHRWSSLVCTVFLLLLCLTGLPLVFSEEIGHWLDDTPVAEVAPGTPRASLDGMVQRSLQQYPGQQVYSIVAEQDEPRIKVFMTPSFDEARRNPASLHVLHFDAFSGDLAKPPDPKERSRLTFMTLMLKLHTDLFVGLAGELFLGAMGLLFVVALVSGVVLYAPFMRKLAFGTVRTGRSTRLAWLDWHNLLGIAMLCWMGVVGVTGVINELATPMFAAWRANDMRALLSPWQGQQPPAMQQLASVQAALTTAMAAQPDMQVVSVVYPGNPAGSPHHYLIWAKGHTPFTSQLYSPALVDAISGELTGVVPMPWYLVALQLSRPLHFGDYAGLPLKILWLVLDLVAIVVLVSGLYLWWVRRKVTP